jgi:hypothetical protein
MMLSAVNHWGQYQEVVDILQQLDAVKYVQHMSYS